MFTLKISVGNATLIIQFTIIVFTACKFYRVPKMKVRKSKRLAKKETTHYEEPVVSDDDDYICEYSIVQ